MSSPLSARPEPLQPGSPEAGRPGLWPRLAAEAFGSLFLALAGLGVPLFSLPQSSPLPSALAAGLAVTAAMLAFGHVSGGHFNPAITVGHLLAGRIRPGAAAAYLLAQVAGALAGAGVLFAVLRTLPGIADSRTAFDTVTAGFGEHSIIQAPLAAVLLLELVGAAIIVSVFLGAVTRENAGRSTAAVSVGLAFAALLQLGQSAGNLPYNPARAIASAVFSSGWALEQLWVFLAAPLVGGALAGLAFRSFGAAPVAGDDQKRAALESTEEAPETSEPTLAPDTARTSLTTDEAGPGANPRAGKRSDAASEAQEFFEGKRR